jgi:hypothetical protein
MQKEDRGGRVISPSSSPSLEDPNPVVYPLPAPSLPGGQRSSLVLSLSLSMPTPSWWRHGSPPTLLHPQADGHPAVRCGHPKTKCKAMSTMKYRIM